MLILVNDYPRILAKLVPMLTLSVLRGAILKLIQQGSSKQYLLGNACQPINIHYTRLVWLSLSAYVTMAHLSPSMIDGRWWSWNQHQTPASGVRCSKRIDCSFTYRCRSRWGLLERSGCATEAADSALGKKMLASHDCGFCHLQCRWCLVKVDTSWRLVLPIQSHEWLFCLRFVDNHGYGYCIYTYLIIDKLLSDIDQQFLTILKPPACPSHDFEDLTVTNYHSLIIGHPSSTSFFTSSFWRHNMNLPWSILWIILQTVLHIFIKIVYHYGYADLPYIHH